MVTWFFFFCFFSPSFFFFFFPFFPIASFSLDRRRTPWVACLRLGLRIVDAFRVLFLVLSCPVLPSQGCHVPSCLVPSGPSLLALMSLGLSLRFPSPAQLNESSPTTHTLHARNPYHSQHHDTDANGDASDPMQLQCGNRTPPFQALLF